MKLDTTRFGEIELDAERIIRFPQGIPGFEKMRRFTIVSVAEHEPFTYLQSADDGELAFIIMDPFESFPQYDIQLPERAVTELDIQSPDDIIIRTIVSIGDNIETATTNLVAPIVINRTKRIGKQVVLTTTNYTTHYRLFSKDSTE
jgi:flagellar assembly factor FliW